VHLPAGTLSSRELTCGAKRPGPGPLRLYGLAGLAVSDTLRLTLRRSGRLVPAGS
jgi:hypothetical protein